MYWQSLMLYFHLFPLQLFFLLVKSDLVTSHMPLVLTYMEIEQVHFIWAFVVRFYPEHWIYWSLRIALFQLFVLVNYILCFLKCNFTSHGICINFDNQQIYYLINLYFFVACVGQWKSILTRYLGTLSGFQNYELLDFILQCELFSSIVC